MLGRGAFKYALGGPLAIWTECVGFHGVLFGEVCFCSLFCFSFIWLSVGVFANGLNHTHLLSHIISILIIPRIFLMSFFLFPPSLPFSHLTFSPATCRWWLVYCHIIFLHRFLVFWLCPFSPFSCIPTARPARTQDADAGLMRGKWARVAVDCEYRGGTLRGPLPFFRPCDKSVLSIRLPTLSRSLSCSGSRALALL
jgi:hypothetical protein